MHLHTSHYPPVPSSLTHMARTDWSNSSTRFDLFAGVFQQLTVRTFSNILKMTDGPLKYKCISPKIIFLALKNYLATAMILYSVNELCSVSRLAHLQKGN